LLSRHHLQLVSKAKKSCEIAAVTLGKIQNSSEHPWKFVYEAYEHIQTAALWLQQIPEPRTEGSPLAPVAVADQDTKATASLTANGLRIVVNEPLPTRIKSRARYSLERQRWLAMIVNAIQQAGVGQVEYEKAFVLIKVFFPNRKQKDLDNLEIKFVLDAIRYARLVPDDSWDHLTYLPLGDCDPTSPRTELLVMNWDKVEPILLTLTQP